MEEACEFAKMVTQCCNPEGENNPNRIEPKDHNWPQILCGSFGEYKSYSESYRIMM